MNDILTPDEIAAMRKYLTDFPPLVPPPPDLPMFDVKRICATLESFLYTEAVSARQMAELQDQVFTHQLELKTYRLWLATFLDFMKTAPQPVRTPVPASQSESHAELHRQID